MKKSLFYLFAVAAISFVVAISCEPTNPSYPQIITPILIAQGELYGNGEEGITKQNLVIRTQQEWDNLLNAMNSVNNVSGSFSETEIDFNSYIVIAVFDEVRGNSGCSINIAHIIEYIDSIVVDVHNATATSDADVMNQPYYIVKIPATNKNIVFGCNVSNDTVPTVDFNYQSGSMCYANMQPNTVYVINSENEFANYFNCGTNSQIDFATKTLLVAYGTVLGSTIDNKVVELIHNGNNYTLNVAITINEYFFEDNTVWTVAVIVDKINSPNIMLNSYKTNITENTQFTVIGQGSWYRQDATIQFLLITNNTDWTDFLSAVTEPYIGDECFSALPLMFTETNIDFSQFILILLLDEGKPKLGWSINVTNIEEYSDKIVVTIENLHKGNLLSAVSRPFQVVKIPVTDKPIIFNDLTLSQ